MKSFQKTTDKIANEEEGYCLASKYITEKKADYFKILVKKIKLTNAHYYKLMLEAYYNNNIEIIKFLLNNNVSIIVGRKLRHIFEKNITKDNKINIYTTSYCGLDVLFMMGFKSTLINIVDLLSDKEKIYSNTLSSIDHPQYNK